ncbi:insulinase family protein [Pelagicoccus sp. SDUM812002]|uniref:M16 family metallopeptidase n=1 Tax=Pelagicoccus sp. SDUM812002 TaxID=3041266 RepID=UPI0028101BF1|nr:insulinase family protein [Pelagicoccus sp. SDUM812002]MDQ8184909.1 insulinase family protein [Pelagicoccus sp. SDUM812002]
MLKRLFAFLSLSISLSVLTPIVDASNAFAGQWPLLPEGNSPEAGEIWGELPNGLRYVIVPTDSAAEAVSLRLMVAAGRAQEEKGKAGVSQLLIDLANFGTSGVSRDQLVQFKLANGINPQSGFFSEVDLRHTLFRLDLEEPRSGGVDIGLGLLYEIAAAPRFDEVSFGEVKARMEYFSGLGISGYEPKQAVKERVLLRSSPYSKLSDTDIRASLPGIELSDVKSFWSNWYKADRMVLVVAGVVESEQVESLIKEKFSTLESSAELVPLPSKDNKFRSGGDVETADSRSSTAGLWISNTVEVGSLFKRASELEYYTLDFIGRIAQSYATDSESLPNSIVEMYGDFAAVSINRRGPVMSLLEQILSADKAVHRIAQHGVRAEDLELAKAEYLNLRYSYDMEVSSKEWSPLVADRLVRCVLEQIPFRYGAKLSDYLQGIISRMTLESVKERCAQLFREKALSYYLELPDGVPLGAKTIAKRLKGMRKSYDFTWEQAGSADQDWNFGAGFESGGMVKSTEIIRFEEYPVLKYEFANNLRMNLVRSDAFKGRVQMMVSLGNGTSEMGIANPAYDALLRTLMLSTKIGNGVEAPTVKDVLRDKGIDNIEAGVTKDHLYWSGVASDDAAVESFFSTILIWMVTGNLNEENFNDELEKLETLVEDSFEENSSVQLDTLLYAQDDRLRNFFSKEDVEALKFSDMQQWLGAVRENAYIEVTVVGDVLPRTVLRDVRKTFGSAPSRSGKVLQPRHGKKVKWNEPGVSRDTFKKGITVGNITLLFPQVGEKSCTSDRVGSVLLPLFEEHLKRALASNPAFAGNLSVELVGEQMIPLSNAVKVRLFCSKEDAAEAEAMMLQAAGSFEASLTEPLLIAAERNALLGLKRIARSQPSLVNLFKQSQGKPNTLGCVVDLLENGFGLSFDEYKDLAARQFSEENVRGVSLMPAK